MSRIDGKAAQIVTAYTPDRENEKSLYCYLYQPIVQNRYRQIFIDSQGINGGLAELVSLFSANADTTRGDEIVALFRWYVKHYMTGGYIYEIKYYKRAVEATGGLQIIEKPPVSSKGFEGYREGKHVHAKYNTEAKIRRRLKQLGY